MQVWKLLRILVVFVAVAILLSVASGSFGTWFAAESRTCTTGARASCVTADGYAGYRTCADGALSPCFIASLDDCQVSADATSQLCCAAKDGSLADCNARTSFAAGEYVMVKVNLQQAMSAAGVTLASYKACVYTDLIPTSAEIPDHYANATAFATGSVACSAVLRAQDYQEASADGFVPRRASVQLADVRVFSPDVDVSTPAVATAQRANGIRVFSQEVAPRA